MQPQSCYFTFHGSIILTKDTYSPRYIAILFSRPISFAGFHIAILHIQRRIILAICDIVVPSLIRSFACVEYTLCMSDMVATSVLYDTECTLNCIHNLLN